MNTIIFSIGLLNNRSADLHLQWLRLWATDQKVVCLYPDIPKLSLFGLEKDLICSAVSRLGSLKIRNISQISKNPSK